MFGKQISTNVYCFILKLLGWERWNHSPIRLTLCGVRQVYFITIITWLRIFENEP